MRVEKALTRSIRRRLALTAGAAVLSLASTASLATITCNATPISVPANIDGVYLNIVTGAQGTAGGSVAGWDINLYQTGASALYFFWPSSPANSYGGVSTATVYDVLANGAPIGSGQTYIVNSGGGGPAPFANWQAGSTGQFLGVRFWNESTSAINYGWLQLNTTGPTGFPATINEFCFQNDGTQITAGTRPVSLQKFSVD